MASAVMMLVLDMGCSEKHIRVIVDEESEQFRGIAVFGLKQAVDIVPDGGSGHLLENLVVVDTIP